MLWIFRVDWTCPLRPPRHRRLDSARVFAARWRVASGSASTRKGRSCRSRSRRPRTSSLLRRAAPCRCTRRTCTASSWSCTTTQMRTLRCRDGSWCTSVVTMRPSTSSTELFTSRRRSTARFETLRLENLMFGKRSNCLCFLLLVDLERWPRPGSRAQPSHRPHHEGQAFLQWRKHEDVTRRWRGQCKSDISNNNTLQLYSAKLKSRFSFSGASQSRDNTSHGYHSTRHHVWWRRLCLRGGNWRSRPSGLTNLMGRVVEACLVCSLVSNSRLVDIVYRMKLPLRRIHAPSCDALRTNQLVRPAGNYEALYKPAALRSKQLGFATISNHHTSLVYKLKAILLSFLHLCWPPRTCSSLLYHTHNATPI